MSSKKSIAYIIDELFYYDSKNNCYVSKFSAGNFLKLLQKNLDMECDFVFPVSKKPTPSSYSTIFKTDDYKVEPLPGWEGVISYYQMLLNPKVSFLLKSKVAKLINRYDIFWIRIPSPFGLRLGRAAEKQGKFVIYNVVGDIRLAHNSEKYKGLKNIFAKTAGYCFHRKSLSTSKNSVFLCVGSVLYNVYKKAHKEVEFFIDSLVKSEDIKMPKVKLSNPLKILYVGKLVRSKGIYFLIDTIKELNCKYKLELHMVGHGEECDRVKKSAHENKFIKFHGFVPQGAELNKIYSDCDILIMPSILSEGFPRVILEAWSNGLIVISANIGGIESLGQHLKNILFFEPGNKNSLIEQIELVLHHSNVREELRKGIIDVQKVISSDYMIERVKNVLIRNSLI